MVAPALASAADPTDPGYQRNAKEHAELVAQLRSRLADTALGGPEKSRIRHVERGKLLPRARVGALPAPGSPFLELSPRAANGLYDDQAPAAGIIPGVGRVEG